MPSQRLSQPPYETWVCLNGKGDIHAAHCKCMAGLGQVCVHVAALLFKVEAGVKLGYTSTSSTSESCTWNSQLRTQLNVCPVSEISLDILKSGRKISQPCVTSSSTDPLPDIAVLQKLKECCPDGVFFTLIPKLSAEDTDTAEEDGSTTLMPLLTSLGNETIARATDIYSVYAAYKASCSISAIEQLEAQTRGQADVQLWHEHRKGRITGTTFHKIITARDTTSSEALVKAIISGGKDLSHLPSIRWGKDNERRALDEYSKYKKLNHQNFVLNPAGLLVDEEDVFFGVSADGVIECDCCGKGVVEVKCPYKYRNQPVLDAARNADFYLSPTGNLKKSHNYYSQVQFEMFIHKVQYCDFVVLTNRDFCVDKVARNDAFINPNVDKCREFWMNNVAKALASGNK